MANPIERARDLLLESAITLALIAAVSPSSPLFGAGNSPLVYFIHNPEEAVALKLAINAATQVGLDLASIAGRGATRLFRHFRPPTATTLAV